MRKLLLFGFLSMLFLVFAGCGDNNDAQPVFRAYILSDQPADGDIAFNPVRQSYTITNGPDTLFFGIDDSDPNFPEYRAFLDFPLDGTTGEDTVPSDATIISATLRVFINEVSFSNVVPTLLDFVIFPITGLRVEDFDSQPLLSRGLDFFVSDAGNYVSINVTSFMQEAQRLGLNDFQVRFLLDLDANFGFVGIEDRPTIAITAPQLTVVYTF